jgi:hypothetical protein
MLSAWIWKKWPGLGPHRVEEFIVWLYRMKIKEPGKYVAAAVAAYHDTKTAIAPFPKVPLTLLKLREKKII